LIWSFVCQTQTIQNVIPVDIPMKKINSLKDVTTAVLSIVLVCLFSQLCFSSQSFRRITVRADNGQKKEVELYGASYALLVAASRYKNGWATLETIPAETDKLEALLKAKGFQVTRVNDPTGVELQQAYAGFIAEYGYEESNRLLFFYSGHGHTRKNGTKGYLVPVDAPDPGKKRQLFLRKALPMTRILAWARDIEAKHVLFLFDSCFSGTVFKQKDRAKPSKFISNLSMKPVRQFITAGSADEPVPSKSTFTPALIDAIQYGTADRNNDHYVTGTELGVYLQEKIPQHTKQNPQYGKISDYDLSRGDFIFLAGGSPEDFQSSTFPDEEQIVLPPETRIISDYDARIKQRQAAQKKWQSWQKKMDVAFKKVEGYDTSQALKKDEKISAWRDFIKVFEDGNPHTLTDEQYRKKAKARISYWQKKQDKVLVNNTYSDPITGMEFVFVKGGCYQMGDTFNDGDSDEKPVHEVCLDSFYMGKYEVSQGEWEKIMELNLSDFQKGDDYPVEQVSWRDSQKFIEKLNSKKEMNYRLPTEAEWEYAAREGGKRVRFGTGKDTIGADEANFDASKNYKESYSQSGKNKEATVKVKSFSPNKLGLYNMGGNVEEWCLDRYDAYYYSSSPRNNPQGASGGQLHVIRGGGWYSSPEDVRAASRIRYDSIEHHNNLGFRLVLPRGSK